MRPNRERNEHTCFPLLSASSAIFFQQHAKAPLAPKDSKLTSKLIAISRADETAWGPPSMFLAIQGGKNAPPSNVAESVSAFSLTLV